MLYPVSSRKSGSKLLGIWTFLLFFILKGASPKPAFAFVSSLDACAAQPECAAAISSEVAPAVATPTASGVATTITSTTAAGASTTTQAAAGVVVVGDMRLSGIAAYYLWSQGVNGQAQEKARQRYCAAYPTDEVCTPFTGGQGNCILYRVDFTEYARLLPNGYPQYDFVWGPLLSVTSFFEPGPQGGYWGGILYESKGRDAVCGNQGQYRIVLSNYEPQSSNRRFIINRITRADGQPDISGNQPPLPWKDWSQEKRSIAVAALTNSDWLGLITSMPEAGRLLPGDKANAPTIVIPGEQTDDPITPQDDRLPRKERGFFTNPGSPNTDFDKDGTPDTADPEPQNPNVPRASSEPSNPPEESGQSGEESGSQPTEDDMWADLDQFNNPSIGAPTTPEGRTLSNHAQESLPRHGFEEPYSKVDEIIDNASRQTPQEDGATVYIQANRDGTYNIAIVNEQEGTVVTAMQNLEPRELRQLGQNYGFDPNP